MPEPEEVPAPPEVFDLAISWEPIDSIRPHPENPRRGDVEAIRASIRKNGLYAPIYVRSATKQIIKSTHVWRACKLEGLTEVPVVWLDVNAQDARRILLADNGTGDLATNDDEALLIALRKVQSTPGGLFGSGYTDDALNVLVARVEGQQVTAASDIADQVPPAYVPDGEAHEPSHTVALIFTAEQFALWSAYLEHIRGATDEAGESDEAIVLTALHALGDDLGD